MAGQFSVGVNTVRTAEARQVIVQSFPEGTKVTDPHGGFLLWVEMPKRLDSQALYRACLAEGICIAPGTLFSASDRYRNFIRLSVSGSSGEDKLRALRRIGDIATSMLESQLEAAC